MSIDFFPGPFQGLRWVNGSMATKGPQTPDYRGVTSQLPEIMLSCTYCPTSRVGGATNAIVFNTSLILKTQQAQHD